MKTKALRAWVASLPLALLPPIFIGTCIIAFTAGIELDDLRWPALILVYTAVIHFTAYLITGLPIFLLQFGKPDSTVWTLPGAIISGVCLGGLALCVSGAPQLFLIGFYYGFITAIAAYRQRPHYYENAHHLP